MLLIEFFSWWYLDGWKKLATEIELKVNRLWYLFSIPTLVKTLFAPWKRMITSPGKTIQDHIRAIGDNFVSRLVGFFVRAIVIVAAVVVISFAGVVGLVAIIAWPLMPPVIVLLFIRGLV